MQHSFHRRAATTLVAVVALVTTATACFPDVSGGEPVDAWDARMYRAINAQRGAAGMPPLANSPKLGNLAGSWAHQMATDGWPRHQDLLGVLYWPEFASVYTIGENLVVADGSAAPEHVAALWMQSDGHRANMLNPSFNVVGVGHVWGPDGRVWVVADFGGL